MTAGVDFGLTVLAKIKGQEAAEFTQLALEYAPEPPFNAGHPRTAKPETIAAVKTLMRDFTPKGVEIAKAPRQRVTASSSKLITT